MLLSRGVPELAHATNSTKEVLAGPLRVCILVSSLAANLNRSSLYPLSIAGKTSASRHRVPWRLEIV
jgi:hypothetical protein